jgi:hypothetical protein
MKKVIKVDIIEEANPGVGVTVSGILIKDGVVNDKLTNQSFTGTINLCYDFVHYSNWTANSSAQVLLAANPIIGGSAEIRLIGDGTNTPTFSADFTKSAGSSDYDPTLNKVNKVVFYYDGTSAFYSITVL